MAEMLSDELRIRADLEDISNTIKHLHELAAYFHRNDVEHWSELWYATKKGGRWALEGIIDSMDDREFSKVVAQVYIRGRGTAFTLSSQLTLINYIDLRPRLKEYIDEIRAYQDWIKPDEELLAKCERIITERDSYDYVNYWAIRQMIQLHREQLQTLRDLDSDLYVIENSERYKLENRIALNQPMRNAKNVFVIHGHDDVCLKALEGILRDDLGLNPIVLKEQPDRGATTIIEKFEFYAPKCSYAFAIFTPDDEVEKEGKKYLQTRPNVIFELGWFCAYLGRNKVSILLQEGTDAEALSDFQGVLQKRFGKNIREKFEEIEKELITAGLIQSRE
jgi:predicted nucleotide-binding protein